jgi:hypothetical protein
MPESSKSGVRLADSFRDNLLIDRYAPCFSQMRGEKREYMRSENSEDVLTWNVFRSLGEIEPSLWLSPLFSKAFGSNAPAVNDETIVRLWERVRAPASLRTVQKDEGESEIDIMVESHRTVVFIEAKYRSDVSLRTTNNMNRDQIMRNLDVGSYWAAPRDFYFILLILNEARSPEGVRLLSEYRSDQPGLAGRLAHRGDGLSNLRGLGLLTWSDFAEQAAGLAADRALTESQRAIVGALADWLAFKGIGTSRPK